MQGGADIAAVSWHPQGGGSGGTEIARRHRQRLPRLALVQPQPRPSGRVGHADVADLLLGDGVAIVRLGRLGQKLLEVALWGDCLPSLAGRVAALHGGQDLVLPGRVQGGEVRAETHPRGLVQPVQAQTRRRAVGRHVIIAPAVTVAAGQAGVHGRG